MQQQDAFAGVPPAGHGDGIRLFLDEALNCTAAFKAVQSTASFLRQHTQNNEVLLMQVNYAVREAYLSEDYAESLSKVLKVFDERPFSSSGRNPKARQCAEIWHAWSNLLDAIDEAGGENHDDALGMVMALGRMDANAVWQMCWHYVRKEVTMPDKELEYGLMAKFIGEHMMLTVHHSVGRFHEDASADEACEHGFMQWYRDEASAKWQNIEPLKERMLDFAVQELHWPLKMGFGALPTSYYHDHDRDHNNGWPGRLMMW